MSVNMLISGYIFLRRHAGIYTKEGKWNSMWKVCISYMDEDAMHTNHQSWKMQWCSTFF